jgi:hypothetical protein
MGEGCKHLLEDWRRPNNYYCCIVTPCEHLLKNEVDCPIMPQMRAYANGTYKSYNLNKQKMIDELSNKQKSVT